MMFNSSILVLVAFLTLLAVPSFADSTQQFIKIPLEPSYSEGIGIKGADFVLAMDNFNFSKIVSIMINFNVFTKEDTTFLVTVDGMGCLNSKSFAARGSSRQIIFDCSNVVTGMGKYLVTVVADSPVASAFGWAEVSYFAPEMTCPVQENITKSLADYYGTKAFLSIHGTDYWQGEKATVFLQLQDTSGQAVNNASCNFDLYNTSNPLSNPIYNKQPMVFRGADGIYYYQFLTTGLPEGVYPMDAECFYVYDNYYFYQGVSQAINVTTNTGTFIGGAATGLNAYDDDLYMGWSLTQNLTFMWVNVTNSTGNVTRMEFYWLGETSVARTLTFYAYNYTSSSYNIVLGTKLTTASGSTTTPTGLDEIFAAVVPSAAYNGTTVSVIMSSSGSSTMFINWVTLKAFKNSTYVSEVKGSSEVHIYPASPNLTVDMNYSRVWNSAYAPARTLTDYNTSQIYSLMLGINMTAQQIFALSHDMNLTSFQTLQLLQAMNVTQSEIMSLAGQINLTANDIKILASQTNLTVSQILGYVRDINLTVGDILFIASDINLTASQTYDLLRQINMTFELKLDQINATTYGNYLLLLNLTDAVKNITVNLTPVLSAIQDLNLSVGQIWSLQQFMNVTFEQKLDNINNTLNNLTINVSQLVGIANGINLTASQTYQLLQSMNLTQQQIWSLLLGMNVSVSQILNLSNLTYVNTNDILLLSLQTNTTVNHILGIVQGLNLTIGNITLGNITLNTNLTSATIGDISEKVWLEFLTLGTPPLLKSTAYSCIDNMTLQKDNTFTITGPGGDKSYTKSEQEYCPYGCDPKNNQCVPPPVNRAGFIALAIVGVIGFIIIVRRFM